MCMYILTSIALFYTESNYTATNMYVLEVWNRKYKKNYEVLQKKTVKNFHLKMTENMQRKLNDISV